MRCTNYCRLTIRLCQMVLCTAAFSMPDPLNCCGFLGYTISYPECQPVLVLAMVSTGGVMYDFSCFMRSCVSRHACTSTDCHGCRLATLAPHPYPGMPLQAQGELQQQAHCSAPCSIPLSVLHRAPDALCQVCACKQGCEPHFVGLPCLVVGAVTLVWNLENEWFDSLPQLPVLFVPLRCSYSLTVALTSQVSLRRCAGH